MLRSFIIAGCVLLLAGCGEAQLSDGVEPSAAAGRRPSRGLDSLLLAQAFERAGALPRLHALLVARHGELVREEYFRGPGPNRPANLKSASKSIISTLVGIAIAEGHREGLDQPIAEFFPEYIGDGADPRLGAVTIGNLLSIGRPQPRAAPASDRLPDSCCRAGKRRHGAAARSW